MFHHLSHSVGSFIKSLKSALGTPQKQDEAPQNSVRKHDKKRRRQRHPSDTAYIRKADSRQASSAAARTKAMAGLPGRITARRIL